MVVNAWKDDLTNRISLADPILGDEEKEALCGVIDSGWMTMGERVAEFERSFANLHRVEDAIAVSSCTAGLHLTLQALGIEQGDEVLVPSLTFVATVNARDTVMPEIEYYGEELICSDNKLEFMIICQPYCDIDIKIPRVALVAIFASVVKFNISLTNYKIELDLKKTR